jgi:hypothetical protein
MCPPLKGRCRYIFITTGAPLKYRHSIPPEEGGPPRGKREAPDRIHHIAHSILNP